MCASLHFESTLSYRPGNIVVCTSFIPTCFPTKRCHREGHGSRASPPLYLQRRTCLLRCSPIEGNRYTRARCPVLSPLGLCLPQLLAAIMIDVICDDRLGTLRASFSHDVAALTRCAIEDVLCCSCFRATPSAWLAEPHVMPGLHAGLRIRSPPCSVSANVLYPFWRAF